MRAHSFSLTDEQIAFYHTTGYLVIGGVFSHEKCDRAVAIYEKYALPDFRGIMNIERGYVEYRDYGKTLGAEEIIGKIDVEEEDAKTILDMLKHPKIVTALDTLQGEETILLQSMFLFKKVGTPYAHQAWWPHQDNAYARADYGMYITGNLCFSDQYPENGGMYIYSGSHIEPILPHDNVKSFHETPGERPGNRVHVPEQYTSVDLYLKKGCVLFLNGHVIHGSYPNLSKIESRPMLLVPYGTKGVSKGKNFCAGRVAKRMEISIR